QGDIDAWMPTSEVLCGQTKTVQPEGDINICNGQLVEATNDGESVTTLAIYPKQPFDIANRTGIVTFDVSNDTEGTHAAWPEFWYTDKPVPTPFTHGGDWISLPRDGFGLRLSGQCTANQGCGACPGVASYDRVGVDTAIVVNNFVLNDGSLGGTVT